MNRKDTYSGNFRCQMPPTTGVTGWKFFVAVGTIAGAFGMMLWPIAVDPVLHVDKYKESHKKLQTEFFQAGLLPGQLKKWEDPWKRSKN